MTQFTDKELFKFFQMKTQMSGFIGRDRVEEKPFERICLEALCVNSQKGAPVIERWVRNKFGFDKAEGQGDFIDGASSLIEFKYSFITETKNQFDFNQIRPNQDIQTHLLLGIDVNSSFKLYCFKLNKTEIRREIERFGVSSHGRKAYNTQSFDKEYSLKIKYGSTEFDRFCKLYRSMGTEKFILKG